LAIHALQPQTSTALNAKIAEIERRNISRFLHGTLSQDLAVLQIKLDQLMHNIDRLADTASAQHELEGIQSIADQTCRQIRSLMADLHGNPSADLTATLIEYANQISQRAHFQLQITHEGEPRSLASQVQRQIFYLFQEALINIEKHARAQRVVITIAWTNDCFNLTVLDDGQGFDMDVVRDGTDHYGMTVIKEITEELIGILRLESAPQMGTRITFTLPLQKVSEGGLDVSVDSYQPSYS
jgi:signal transduction histidine kinase